jgi:group I intron endonuclease
MIGIYSISNTANGKRYIGQSRDISKRLWKHRTALSSGIHENLHLQNAYNKYGSEKFTFCVLRECSVDELDAWERILIRHYDSIAHGYNLESGGRFSKTISQETRQRMSESHKKRFEVKE